MEQRIGFCTRPDGVRIAYAIAGDGPPLVKIGPWGHLEKNWQNPRYRAFFEALAQHHTLIRYDKYGTGLSDRDRTVFTLDEEVRDLEALADHLELDRFALLGCSGEGPTTIAYAVRHPDRVTHLILYGTFANGPDVGTPEVRESMNKLIRTHWGVGHKVVLDIFGGGDPEAEEYLGDTGIWATPETTADIFNLVYEIDVRDLLPRISVPTLVLHRERDRVIPFRLGRELAAAIPDARFVRLEGRVNIPCFGETETMLNAIGEFLGDPLDEQASPQKLLRERYEPIEQIGSGGQGEVVRALDHQHERHVALKIRPVGDPDARKALLSEARVLLGLRPHHALPLVRDDFFADDRYVIVMDWVEGTDLRTLLDDQGDPGLPVGSVLRYMSDVAEALDHLHSHDDPPIVHGDVKPANCILAKDGRVVLVDFGIASGGGSAHVAGSGTRGFVAPEVAAGEPATPAADIFGLAATTFALLTGHSPEDEWPEFEGVAAQTARALGRAIRLGLSVDPSRRPRRASEFVERLRSWEEAAFPTGTVTFLFTDIEGSTPLWEAHPEDMPRVIARQEALIAGAVEASGGRFVKSRGEGDSTLSVFTRASDAVSAAIAMQRSLAAESWPSGIEVRVRAGMHTGEAQLREGDYYGQSVNRAARIRSLASGGQILVSQATEQLVRDSLPTNASLVDVGARELKGLTRAEQIFEIHHPDLPELDSIAELPTGFDSGSIEIASRRLLPVDAENQLVGRRVELESLREKLNQAVSGRGGVILIAGEPGIGKTRLASALADEARRNRALVLWGRAYEGDWQAPFGPFGEALDGLAGTADPQELRAILGEAAPPLTKIAPGLRRMLPGIPKPEPISSDEERYRLLDAVSQTLVALAKSSPVVVVLDDLHWADGGSVAMLRHAARLAASNPVLFCGTYRDVELEPGHPFADALEPLRHDADAEVLRLGGLDALAIGELVDAVAERSIPQDVTAFVATETAGNPFFAREIVLHLLEQSEGTDLILSGIGTPQGAREVVRRRVRRLSDNASALLTTGSAFEGGFALDIAASAATIDDIAALDALDEAIGAQLLVPSDHADIYDFAHAIVRHALYEDLSPSRRTRLHRRLAETLIERLGEDPPPARCAEIASHYVRSSALPGAESGVDFALKAAEHAESAGAHDEVAALLRTALDLMPDDDRRRLRINARLGIALAWAQHFDEATDTALVAASDIAEAEGDQPAAMYLADAVNAFVLAGSPPAARSLASAGLTYAKNRDVVWATLVAADIARREIEDPDNPGMPLDVPERREAAHILRSAGAAAFDSRVWIYFPVFESRTEALASASPIDVGWWAGEYGAVLPINRRNAEEAESRGQLASAIDWWAWSSRFHTALGEFAEARACLERATDLAERLMGSRLSGYIGQALTAALYELTLGLDDGWDELTSLATERGGLDSADLRWSLAAQSAAWAVGSSRMGLGETVALPFLSQAIPALERCPTWAINFVSTACAAAETLWVLERTDHIESIEGALRNKVVTPDFRYPSWDGRLGLARVSALQRRYNEAIGWFNEARKVLDEQGARPLRAIVDHDEALMYARRRAVGDVERALPLLSAARQQFEALGMPGWLRRVQSLAETLAGESLRIPASSKPPTNLPATVDEFIGRSTEKGEVQSALDGNRLVTLAGPGGSGKTRLAVEVAGREAWRFPDGVWFVDLSTTSDPEQVAALVARAVAVTEQPGRPIAGTLTETFADRSALIVLDNCEHVIDGAGAVAGTLLSACTAVRILATSRELLAVPGERVVQVPPLTLPGNAESPLGSDAVALFTVRAKAARPRFDPDLPALKVIADICTRLDGLPLAIELAAARTKAMSPREIAERLDDRFRLLTGGSRTALPRQRTLEATVAWSYDLLSEQEQRVFDRLSVFVGGCTLDAAEQVCSGDGIGTYDVVDHIASLADRSLVVVNEGPSGRTRYRQLETLRQFGRDRLAAKGELAAVRDKHLAWVVGLAPTLPGQTGTLLPPEIDDDDGNIRVAIAWAIESGDHASGLRIVADVWTLRGHFHEHDRFYRALLPHADELPPDVAGRAFAGAGGIAFMMGDWTVAAERYQEACEAARKAGDQHIVSLALQYEGGSRYGLGEDEEASRLLDEGLAVAEAANDAEMIRRALIFMAWMRTQKEGDESALELAGRVDAMSRTDGTAFDQAHSREVLGFAQALTGDLDSAAATLAEAVPLFERVLFGCSSHILETAAAWAAMSGEFELGAELWGGAERVRDETGDKARPWERIVHEQWLPKIRQCLDEGKFVAAKSRGAAMTREEALVYAERKLKKHRR